MKKLLKKSIKSIITLSSYAFLGPRIVQINPTVLCNHRCIMCWMTLEDRAKLREKAKYDLTFDQYKHFIDGFPFGVKNVTIIGGGEPLVHKDTFNIIKYIKGKGYRVNLNTNGSLLTPKKLREIVEGQWDVISYSLHAANKDTYKSIHQVDRFEKVKEGIFLIRDLKREKSLYNPYITLIFAIQKDNYKELSQMLDFSKEAEANSVSLTFAIPYNPLVALSEKEVVEFVEIIEKSLREKYPFSHNLQNLYNKVTSIEKTKKKGDSRYTMPGKKCLAGWFVTNVTTDGFVRPCCFSDEYMGNIKEESFKEIWNSPKYRRFRRELKKGKFRDYCYSNRCSFEWVV